MIHEFALEPELVASLTERREARYIAENFGLGLPRLVSRYPKSWKRLAWEAFERTHPAPSEGQRKIVEELIQRLSEHMARRGDFGWDPGRSWLENAEKEHDRKPFQAILASTNPRGREEVLIEQGLERSSVRWAVPRGATVLRQARPMTDLVLPLLRCCREVVFIDPYFGPENFRHRRPLEAFLAAFAGGRADVGSLKVEVHAEAKSSTADFFRKGCEGQLTRCIPAGLRVTFRRWMPRSGGETLHNRYILTELGGLTFSHGLDEGKTGETDDVNLMDRLQYELRWQQYMGASPAFDSPEASVVVIGTKKV